MCILKCFSRLVVSSDVQDGFVLESFPFKHFRVEERDFGSVISAVNLIVGWNLLACLIKRSTVFYRCPRGRRYHQYIFSIFLAWYDRSVVLTMFQCTP